MDVTHIKETKFIRSAPIEPIDTSEAKPCRINIQKLLLMSFNCNTRLQIYNNNMTNALPYCNKNDSIQLEVVIKYTT